MSVRTYRLLNLLLLAALVAGSIAVYPTLPERIPRHFGISGQPDAWMQRSLLGWLLLPLLAVGIAGLQAAIVRASLRNPALWNVPDKPRFLALTPAERAPIVERLQAFMGLVGVMTTMVLTVVQASVYAASMRRPPELQGLVTAAVPGLVAVILVAGLRMNARIRTLIREAHSRRATP